MTTTVIVNLLTAFFESITIFMFIKSYVNTNTVPNYVYWALTTAMAGLISISSTIASIAIFNILFIWISIFCMSYVYSRDTKLNFILSTLLVLIFSATEILTSFVISTITGFTLEKAITVESYRILGTVLSKLFAFTVLKLISLKHNKYSSSTLRTSYWIWFFIIFLTSTLAIYLLFMLQYYSNIGEIYKKLTVIVAFGLLYSAFFSIYLYENIIQSSEIKRLHDIFKEQIKAQTKHIDEILVAHKEIRKLRHDMINHNICIKAYFENNDNEAGLGYLEKINDNKVFSDNMISTGNVALDAIINTKRIMAIDKGIEFQDRIQVPERIFVDSIDLCIIFGNALDNAIEACESLKNSHKKISVSVIYGDESLTCKISNTMPSKKNHTLNTTKKDKINHGFGIGNIKSSLSKYKHVCDFTQENNEFILSFIIFEN